MEGKVVLEYLVDVGGELDFKRLTEKRFKKFSIIEKTLTKKYMHTGMIAIVFDMDHTELGGRKFKTSAEIYPIGEFILQFETDVQQYDEIEKLVTLFENEEMKENVKKLSAKVMEKIKACIENPYEQVDVSQPYYFVMIKEKPGKDAVWMTKILRQVKAPSEQEVKDCMKHSLSFEGDDLVVVDYSGTIMFDPTGEFQDSIDMINIALIQLIALKAYDLILDRKVVKAYGEVKQVTGKVGFLPHIRETDRAVSDIIETKLAIADMIGDVMNITKISGDWYLARLYDASSERFKLGEWMKSMKQKLDDIEGFNVMLYQKLDAERAYMMGILTFVMEVLVVILIIIEIVAH